MVKRYQDPLDRVFQALSDPTRRAVLARLAIGEATAGQLAQPFSISLPAMTKHLKQLERAGLLVRKRDGRYHRCSLDLAPLDRAADWIEAYRRSDEVELEKLAAFLDENC